MYPVSLDIAGRLCVVVGGGRVAERKVQGLLAAGGRIRLISPEVTPGLMSLADLGAIEWQPRTYRPADLDGAFLVFVATDSPDVQRMVGCHARTAGLLINVADAPDECDFHVPATIRRGDLTLSIATNGRSPAVAAMVRRHLARTFGEEYGWLTRLAALLREQVLATAEDSDEARKLFAMILHDDIVEWLRHRRWDKLQHHLETVLGRPIGFDVETVTKENP